MGTETLITLALGREPAEPGLMARPPRKRDQNVIDRVKLLRAWGLMGQIGTAFAARTQHSALRAIGVFSNPLLLGGIAFELPFAAAVIYLPPPQVVFGDGGTAALGARRAGADAGAGLGRR